MFASMQGDLLPTRSLKPIIALPRHLFHASFARPSVLTAPPVASASPPRSSTAPRYSACPSSSRPCMLISKSQRVCGNVSARYTAVTFVGQAQLLRRVFASELNFGAQLDRYRPLALQALRAPPHATSRPSAQQPAVLLPGRAQQQHAERFARSLPPSRPQTVSARCISFPTRSSSARFV
jgi:hypothetical protein